jgi:thymidylate kinase
MKSNNFIVVEGFDGSGKTSIAKWLEADLGYTYTKSPTGAFALARELFDDVDCIPLRDRLAFYTGDCIRVSELLRSECLEEKVVLDRYYPSTYATTKPYHQALPKTYTAFLSNSISLILYCI